MTDYRARLAAWLLSEWGLTLDRCGGPRAIGRSTGSWKTGWVLSGCVPGQRHSYYHYRSLREIARRFGFEEGQTQPKPKQLKLIRTSKRCFSVEGATCGLLDCCKRCGGKLLVQDHGGRSEFRYELFCNKCRTCDPNGHRTLDAAQQSVTTYFHGRKTRASAPTQA